MIIHNPKQHKSITLSEPQGTLTRSTNMKCKPNCAPGGTLSKTRLASCSGGILAGSTGEYQRAAPARYWPDTRQDPPARDTQRDTRRDPLTSYSGILSGILRGIHWRAALVGYSASSGGILGRTHWRGYWLGAWCRSIANADSSIKSNNPFPSGGEKIEAVRAAIVVPKHLPQHSRGCQRHHLLPGRLFPKAPQVSALRTAN